MKIKIFRDAAIECVKKFRQKHIDTFDETVRNWEALMEEYTQKLNQWAREGGKRPTKEPLKPQDHTKDYDKLLEYLNANVTDIIEVESYEYDQIFNDEFNWSEGFLNTAAFYSSSGVSQHLFD